MTTQELLENAQLDALGLLDEQEREQFERAFQAAAPALREQIRREQKRLCTIESILPNVEPPTGLWPKVLAAVRAAQTAGTLESARSHAGTDRTAKPLPMQRSAGVHRMWRASALGFATAAVVMAGALLYVQQTATSQETAMLRDMKLAKAVESFGAEYLSEQLFSKETSRLVMTAASGDSKGRAAIFLNPAWDRAMLYCQSVAVGEGQTLRLVVLSENGTVERELDEFSGIESRGGLIMRQVALDDADPKRLALVAAPKGQSADRGQILMRMA
mgnify:CR=1 FL=1